MVAAKVLQPDRLDGSSRLIAEVGSHIFELTDLVGTEDLHKVVPIDLDSAEEQQPPSGRALRRQMRQQRKAETLSFFAAIRESAAAFMEGRQMEQGTN